MSLSGAGSGSQVLPIVAVVRIGIVLFTIGRVVVAFTFVMPPLATISALLFFFYRRVTSILFRKESLDSFCRSWHHA